MSINLKIASPSEFRGIWFKHATDPDGNRMPTIIVSSGSDDSYKKYVLKKQQQILQFQKQRQLQEQQQNQPKQEQQEVQSLTQAPLTSNKQNGKKEQKFVYTNKNDDEDEGIFNLEIGLDNTQSQGEYQNLSTAIGFLESQPQNDEITNNENQNNGEKKLYIWRTAGDSSVRSEHAQKEGEIFDWNSNTPHPGDDYNCRCYAEFINEDQTPQNKYGHGDNDNLNSPPVFPTRKKEGEGDNGDKNKNDEGGDSNLESQNKKVKLDRSKIVKVPERYNKLKNDFISTKYGQVDSSHTTPHSGIDFKAEKGTPIHATQDGIVTRSRYNKDGYGYYVRIENKDKAMEYGHMMKASTLQEGDVIKQGDVLGYAGSTGHSTGPHLHYTERLISDNNLWGTHFNPDEENVNFLLDYFDFYKTNGITLLE